MTVALETTALSRRYAGTWALRDCDMAIAQGSITGLVGPNGAGKSTLLRIAAGLTWPTSGAVEVFGESVTPDAESFRSKVGYLDQLRPLYANFRVKEMLKLGRRLNATWDDPAAREWLQEWGIPLDRRVGKLSIGQQAQVALALCLAKRPQLLLLDEPVASLDPVARHQLLQILLATVTEQDITVVISSHLIGELEPVCDHLVLLSNGRARIAGPIHTVLDEHNVLIGPRSNDVVIGAEVISSQTSGRQRTLLVRGTPTELADDWESMQPSLEEIVFAYLSSPTARPELRVDLDSDLSNGGAE